MTRCCIWECWEGFLDVTSRKRQRRIADRRLRFRLVKLGLTALAAVFFGGLLLRGRRRRFFTLRHGRLWFLRLRRRFGRFLLFFLGSEEGGQLAQRSQRRL